MFGVLIASYRVEISLKSKSIISVQDQKSKNKTTVSDEFEDFYSKKKKN
jgi:hypothetical protein